MTTGQILTLLGGLFAGTAILVGVLGGPFLAKKSREVKHMIENEYLF